jgi:GntR family transcriptional regulator
MNTLTVERRRGTTGFAPQARRRARAFDAPRYRAIESALRARIASLHPGERLPSDSDLCAEFGVSRMTARHAMQMLVDEGLIERDPGRGTFVAEAPAHRRANSLMTFSHEMRRRGRRPSSRLLERVVREATAQEAADLRLSPGAPVVSLRRIRVADEQPITLEVAVLPGHCTEVVMAADLESGSLHEALIAAGHVPTRGHATLTAEAATPEDARHLGIPGGAPLLVERRVVLDQRSRPLERTESRYAGDRYALDVGFSVPDHEEPGIEDDGGAGSVPGPARAGREEAAAREGR